VAWQVVPGAGGSDRISSVAEVRVRVRVRVTVDLVLK